MIISRKLLLAGAAVLATAGIAHAADTVRPAPPILAPVAAVAPAPTWDGFLSISGGQEKLSLDGDSESVNRFTLRGSVETMFGPRWGVQFDALGDHASENGTVNALDGAAHIFVRGANGLLGGFIQYRNIGAAGENDNAFFVGPEAQWHMNNFALEGQVAYQSFSGEGVLGSGNETDSGWLANGTAKMFLRPNWVVSFDAGFDSLKADGVSLNVTNLGIGTEVRLNGPLSLFAQYDHIWLNTSPASISASGDVFLVGAKWNIGSMSLQQREASGASLNPVGGLVSFLK